MIITCPACGARFRLSDGALGATGRKLRCGSCRHVWFQSVGPAGEEAEAAAPVTPEPASLVEAEAVSVSGPTGEDQAGEPADESGPRRSPPQDAAARRRPPLTEPDEPLIFAEPRQSLDLRAVVPRRNEPMPRLGAADRAPGEERSRARSGRRRRWRIVVVVLLLLVAAVLAALYLGRGMVMGYLPQSMAVYGDLGLLGPPSSVGLKLQNVSFQVIARDGTPVLEVSGSVVNTGTRPRRLPRMRAELLDGARRTTDFWTFEARAGTLAPGQTTTFHTAYSNPPRSTNERYLFVTFDDTRRP